MKVNIPPLLDKDTMFNVSAGRHEDFFEAADALSDFIKGMDIDTETNNKLIKLACNQVLAAEGDAFMFGFKTALELISINNDFED